MLVRECLQKAPVTVPPECTLEEAAGLMGSHGVGSVLVVSGGALLGIVTDRDIAVRGVGAGQPPKEHVKTVMSDHPIVIQGSADVFEAFRIFKESGIRRLPVLEDDDIAGIVTVDDLLIWLVVELGAVLSPVAGELFNPRTSV